MTAETPVLAVLPHTELYAKSLGAIEEVHARLAPLIVLTDAPPDRVDALARDVIRVPAVDPLLKPILMGIASQLFACSAAAALGRDLDQPRNLAKSVTVE